MYWHVPLKPIIVFELFSADIVLNVPTLTSSQAKGFQSTSLIYSGSGVDRKPLACEDALVFEPNMIIQGK